MRAKASYHAAPSAVTTREQPDTAIAGRPFFGIASIPTPVLIGILGFLLVLVLRLAGVIVGPAAVVLAVICFFLVPGPRRLSDRFILLFAIGFGWMTLLGWIPRLEAHVDVPGILLAASFGVAVANQFHNGRIRWSVRQWPLATETAAIIIGTGATLWFAVPFLRLNLSGRLNTLFPGWDNSAFFDMFRQILQHGGFNSIRYPGPGQGLPQAWVLLVRLWSPHPPAATHWVLNAYGAVLLLTLGAIVTLGCMSVARLCGRDFWVALPAMAAVVQVFVVGRLWILNGYPTFDLPIAAAAAAILLTWRATLSPWLNFFTVAGLTLVAAYTWYPIIVLCAPALIVAAVRLIKASSGRSQTLSTCTFVCAGIAFVAPLIHFHNEANKATLSYASSGVNANATFTPGTPWVLVGLTIAGLLIYAAVRQFTVGDRALGLVAATAAVAALGVVFLVASEFVAANHVSYYGHKFAAGVYGMCLVVLTAVLVSSFATSKLRRRLPTVAVAVLACLASIALLEIDGYVGPFVNPNSIYPTQAKTGFQAHEVLDAPPVFSGEANELIASAQWAQDRPTAGTRWAFINPEGSLSCVQADEWFFALSGEFSVSGLYGEWDHLPCITGTGDAATAAYVVSHFRNPVASHIHLFVSASLAQAIVARNKAWSSPGVLYLPRTRSTN